MENSECKNEYKSIATKNTDPTANVVLLFEMSIKRIDDLRLAEIRRNDDLRLAEGRRMDEQLAIHTMYEDKLALAEQKRLDAIRSVDTTAVLTAADRASAQAQVLAKNVTESAETLRQLVATTAASVASNLANVSSQLTDRLALLEKKQYEYQGRSSVTDPQIDALMKKMDTVIESRAGDKGTSGGRKEMYGWIIGGIMSLIVILKFLFPTLITI